MVVLESDSRIGHSHYHQHTAQLGYPWSNRDPKTLREDTKSISPNACAFDTSQTPPPYRKKTLFWIGRLIRNHMHEVPGLGRLSTQNAPFLALLCSSLVCSRVFRTFRFDWHWRPCNPLERTSQLAVSGSLYSWVLGHKRLSTSKCARVLNRHAYDVAAILWFWWRETARLIRNRGQRSLLNCSRYR